jgi:exonuclease III
MARGAYDDYSIKGRVVGEETKIVARPPNHIRVAQLADCVRAASGMSWSNATLQELAGRSQSRSSPCCVKWMEDVLAEDGMVDSFAEVHPETTGRFTCWDQYKNSRYRNEGSRIDYILVGLLSSRSSSNLTRF